MTIELSPELESLIERKVASGRYGSASDVVQDALRLMDEQDRAHEAELREIRRRVDAGITQADSGETVDGEAFMQGLLDDMDARAAGSGGR